MRNNNISDKELNYAKKTLDAVEECIRRELMRSRMKKSEILDERKYFIDYFAELKDDERKDLLDFEEMDTNTYLRSVSYLSRLAKQQEEPYFAAFRFTFDDDPDDTVECYLSIQTLNDPETDEMLTFDWRAPIASLYYESEPGDAFFETPDGNVKGILCDKRRFRFKHGNLLSCAPVSMPSDDELLSEALSKNAGSHMHSIVETLQAEQHKLIRGYIDGVTVISGCAGSGKTSVALHKAAFILYRFRDKIQNSGIAIISPNDIFTEYISSVLPDLGEDNVTTFVPEDIIHDSLEDLTDFKYLGRLEENEIIDEMDSMRLCRQLKQSDTFREIVLKYTSFLQNNIFVPEDMYLTEDLQGNVEADYLRELFYEQYTDVPLLKRTEEITKQICSKYDIRKEDNKEFIKMSLDGMLLGLTAPVLYEQMYKNPKFSGTLGIDLSPLSMYTNLFEDACAVSVLNIILNEIDFKGIFYLIADEAQDFSPIFLELIRQRFRGTNMLFVGDADQVVFENDRNFVEDIKKIIPRNPFTRATLMTNYRSTSQIVSYAAKVIGRNPSDFHSVREGKEPEIITGNEPYQEISDKIVSLCNEGYESVAVITKTAQEADYLRSKIFVPTAISESARIHFIPVYTAKGLEFDSVILWNEDDPYYKSEKGKYSLYTACTRAMHRLVLVRKA